MNASKTSPAASALSRRHFLKGLGACIALPAFQSLMPRGLAAASSGPASLGVTATGAPLRTAFISFPNGAIPAQWWPSGTEKAFQLSETLQPLQPVLSHLQAISGLDHLNANPGDDGAGDHARGNAVFLTGVRLNKSATDVRAGISIDQVIANHIGHLTRFPSLELTGDAVIRRSAQCDSGYSCAYQFNISWKNETTPMTPESNPRLVFERLFGEGEHGSRAESAQRRMANRRSVLDFVMDDAKRMQGRLDREDQEKLDQYLTGVRDIEKRIEKTEQFGPNIDPEMPTPAGIPASRAEHVDMMYDMLRLAFKTDSTRVATFLMAHDGDNRSFGEIGISEGHHELSHHQNREDRVQKVAQIDRWYVERFARFLYQLDQDKDFDGNSVLYNSRIVYGSGNADGNRHTHTNLPMLLAGHGGGQLHPGRYLQLGNQPASNLFLSLAHQAGLRDLPRFGDSTAPLTKV